jgi:hypothetical protein
MAEIPRFLFNKNWLNAEKVKLTIPKMMPESEIHSVILKTKIQPEKLSPFMIGLFITSLFAAIVFFVCIGAACYCFFKKKPHMEIRRRNQIYLSSNFKFVF